MAVTPPAALASPSRRTLLFIIGVLLALLLIVSAAAAWSIAGHWQDDAADRGAGARKQTPRPPPVFLPMENMVVNLSDPGGGRFAQIGVTLEVEDAQTAELLKSYLPGIRSAILLLVSQRSSAELLQREGKEKLAADILREVSRPLGYPVVSERERARMAAQAQPDGDAQDGDTQEPRHRAAERNPVLRALFSSFIIQ